MYTGIYRPVGRSEPKIFDRSISGYPHNESIWEILAVVKLPPGAVLTRDSDDNSTWYMVHEEQRYYPQDLLDGQLGPIVVWYKAMVS